MALLGVFLVAIIGCPRATPMLAVRVAGYEAPLPPNSFAEEDASGFHGLGEKRIVTYKGVPWETPEEVCTQIDQLAPRRSTRLSRALARVYDQLDQLVLRRRRPDGNLVILYLSAHGVVDADGRACLLLPGAGPREDDRWLPVTELLERLFKEDRQGRPPDELNKLLVLDCHQIQNCWNLGVLENTFADRLEDAVNQADIPNLWVLASAGSGQRAWSAPELNGSVFGTFFRLGIEGAADRATTGNGDGVVSLHELTDYLRTCVDHWVREHRNARQTPVLIGPEQDIQLAYARPSLGNSAAAGDAGPEGTAEASPERQDRRWHEIAEWWEQHERLAAQSPWTRAPLRWARLEHKLLRMEMLAGAGTAYETQYDEARVTVDELISSLESAPNAADVPAYSVASRRAFQDEPEPAAVEAVPAPWRAGSAANAPEGTAQPDAPDHSPGGPAGSDPDSDPAPADEPGAEGQLPPPALDAPYPYWPAAVAVWERCREAPGLERVNEALGFLDGAEGAPEVEPIEVHFLRMLREYLDAPLWDPSKPDFVRHALLAREKAEQAAAPRDVRAAYWSRPLVDGADRQRREAEDRLFIGSPEALDRVQGLWEECQGAYQQSIGVAKRVAEAFELRDRAFARLPYLAAWLLEARLDETEEEKLLDDLRTALDDVHSLAAGLEPGRKDAVWPQEQQERVARLGAALARLDKAHVDEALSTRGGDPENLARIRAALRQPLVTGRRRRDLREKYHTIVGRMEPPGEDYAPDPAQESDAPAGPFGRTARRRLARLGPRHPALVLLGREGVGEEIADALPENDALADSLEQQGRLVRHLLHGGDGRGPGMPSAKGVLERARDGVRESTEAIPGEAHSQAPLPAQYAAVRRPSSDADRLVRAAAALLAPRQWERGSPAVNTPAEVLQQIDLHHWLVWRAERAMEDFWGPRPGHETPYFDAVSEGYLAAATELFRESGPAQAARDRRKARVEAAKGGVRPEQPEHSYYNEDDNTVEHQVAVRWPAGIPQGKAAFYLQQPGESAATAVPRIVVDDAEQWRSEVPIPAKAGRQTVGPYDIRRESLQTTRYLNAVALFRGHRHEVPCEFLPLTGIDIRPEFAEYQSPRITVRGEQPPQVCVMFVVDCSGSMTARADPKQPKGPTRLEEARRAMLETVDALNGPDASYHVGLILYAHRTEWRPLPEGQKSDVGPCPHGFFWHFVTFPPNLKGVNPANDVELVVPMDSLPNVADRIRKEIRGLRARGETPLYLSIMRAIEAISPQAEGRKRHIVVLTDGENKQTPGFEPEDIYVTLSQVERALRRPANKDIQLDVVGFHVTPKERKALEELKGVAEKTGGAFFDADDADALVDALRRSLGLKRFTVARMPAAETLAQEELGRFAQVPCDKLSSGDAPQPNRVHVPDPRNPVHTELDLWGGEGIVLELRERPLRLVHLPFASPWGRRDEVEVELSGERLEVVAHQPYRDDENPNNVRFRVSVENLQRERFTPRPAEVWAEIRPVGEELPDPAPTYVFYDAVFLNGRPVPVLEFVALDWQEHTGGAMRAEIRLWLKATPTPADEQRGLVDLERSPLERGGAEFSARPSGQSTITVTEQHDNPDHVAWAKVELLPSPKGTLRRYFAEAGRCEHVFTIEAGTLYNVRVTTRESLTAGALTPRPLTVAVPSR